jgi:sodium transport system ATP-binding protein
VGVVNGGMGLWDRLTGREILFHFARLHQLDASRSRARIKELIRLLEMEDFIDRRAGTYSSGMKQKVVIARAIVHDPPVLLLDEPTADLDVMARRTVLNFVKEYKAGRKTILYSTHVMSEAQETCDRVAIIHKGRIVVESTPGELISRSGGVNLEDAFFKLVKGSGI